MITPCDNLIGGEDTIYVKKTVEFYKEYSEKQKLNSEDLKVKMSSNLENLKKMMWIFMKVKT